jgi:hypothetical protein
MKEMKNLERMAGEKEKRKEGKKNMKKNMTNLRKEEDRIWKQQRA